MPSVIRGSDGMDSAGVEEGKAKAWVLLSGAVSIVESFNVSSLSDNGVGDYTVNFINPMTSAGFIVAGSGLNAVGPSGNNSILSPKTMALDAVTVTVTNAAGSAIDPSRISVVVFN